MLLIKANTTAIRNHHWFNISAPEEIKALIERDLSGLNAFVIENLEAQVTDEMEKFIHQRYREDEWIALYANAGKVEIKNLGLARLTS